MRRVTQLVLRRRAAQDPEAGFTIVELMITIILLAIVSSGFLAATNAIYNGIHKQQGVTDAADGGRRALQLLDKQVRYASAINTPAVASSGNAYLEYKWTQSNGSTDTLICSQWRLNTTTHRLQMRTWTSGVTPSPAPAWNTVATGVVNSPASQPPFTLPAAGANGATLQYQVLKINLISSRDTGTVNTTSTLTALNTPNSAPPTTPICQELGRS